MIPQDPTLFLGTMRYNLDPENKFPDSELWVALERVGLKTFVTDNTDKLEMAISQKGENLSVGQRQLVCLGRAILCQPKILIMDEATSSVDGEADQLISRVLKHEFCNSTVISIAHRLQTIAGFDRVAVLADGRLVDFDRPINLLSRPSLFRQMVNDSGPANAKMIMDLAQK
jgi:ABC-type multidrug transport system fused ATPase/permease subunit